MLFYQVASNNIDIIYLLDSKTDHSVNEIVLTFFLVYIVKYLQLGNFTKK